MPPDFKISNLRNYICILRKLHLHFKKCVNINNSCEMLNVKYEGIY
jgi:hypothetical protein